MAKPQLKPETLAAIDGNKLNAENSWLATHIEKKTMLEFTAVGGVNCYAGILIALGVYNYLVLCNGEERLLNKAHIESVKPAKS